MKNVSFLFNFAFLFVSLLFVMKTVDFSSYWKAIKCYDFKVYN